MTQYEKDLLLKDLCARLPYGVWYERKIKSCKFGAANLLIPHDISSIERGIFDFYKPYLFPLSSMTEEQKYTCPIGVGELEIFIENANWSIMQIMPDRIIPFFDWLHKNHFDYRGLIEKGLAIDATGKNIYYTNLTQE